MASNLEIRALSLEEMSVPLGWAQQEGWNPGLSDAAAFWHTDPNGFIGGFIDDQAVGTISAVRYGDAFGFMGFYIVKPEFRGCGYGLQLWQAALEHLHGLTSVGLDGVVAQQDNYRKSGFIYAHRNMRFAGKPQLRQQPIGLMAGEKPVDISEVPFKTLAEFDTQHFATSRPGFLYDWIQQPGHHGLAIMRGTDLCAYGVLRPCVSGYKIGPLFAVTPEQARNLMIALCQDLPVTELVHIDPPAENPAAIALMQEFEMTMVFETARMYKGSIPKLPISQIYGITTFELG